MDGAETNLQLTQTVTRDLKDFEDLRINRAHITEITSDPARVFNGGFATVRYARFKDPEGPRREVAIKALQSGGAAVLLRELKTWAPLNHPNILQVLGFHLSEDEAWLVSPWEALGNLHTYLQTQQLSTVDRLRLSNDTANGLAYLHGRSPPMHHGDVKPLNVLLSGRPPQARLCDFGLAGLDEDVTPDLPANPKKHGTTRFLSPELATGRSASRSTTSDVWAWGCLSLQVMTGQEPYGVETPKPLIRSRLELGQPPAKLADLRLPPRMDSLIARCWEVSPVSRPPMETCCRDLTEILAMFSNTTSDHGTNSPVEVAANSRSPKSHRADIGHHTSLGTMGTNPIDYGRLREALANTLPQMAHLRLPESSLKFVNKGVVAWGGYADVKRAEYRKHQWQFLTAPEMVAVKTLRPAGDERQRLRVAAALVREIRVWERLQHENILPLKGFCLRDDFSLAWKTEPDQWTRLQLALDTASGLAYLHGQNPSVIHGNIKLENVVLSSEHRAKLCDFGLCRVEEDVPSGLTTRRGGEGTTRYMSPELVRDVTRHTAQSDVWAWGCLFLVIMLDQRPFAESNPGGIMAKLTEGAKPASLGKFPLHASLRDLMGACWHDEPGTRPDMERCCATLTTTLSLVY